MDKEKLENIKRILTRMKELKLSYKLDLLTFFKLPNDMIEQIINLSDDEFNSILFLLKNKLKEEHIISILRILNIATNTLKNSIFDFINSNEFISEDNYYSGGLYYLNEYEVGTNIFDFCYRSITDDEIEEAKKNQIIKIFLNLNMVKDVYHYQTRYLVREKLYQSILKCKYEWQIRQIEKLFYCTQTIDIYKRLEFFDGVASRLLENLEKEEGIWSAVINSVANPNVISKYDKGVFLDCEIKRICDNILSAEKSYHADALSKFYQNPYIIKFLITGKSHYQNGIYKIRNYIFSSPTEYTANVIANFFGVPLVYEHYTDNYEVSKYIDDAINNVLYLEEEKRVRTICEYLRKSVVDGDGENFLFDSKVVDLLTNKKIDDISSVSGVFNAKCVSELRKIDEEKIDRLFEFFYILDDESEFNNVEIYLNDINVKVLLKTGKADDFDELLIMLHLNAKLGNNTNYLNDYSSEELLQLYIDVVDKMLNIEENKNNHLAYKKEKKYE